MQSHAVHPALAGVFSGGGALRGVQRRRGGRGASEGGVYFDEPTVFRACGENFACPVPGGFAEAAPAPGVVPPRGRAGAHFDVGHVGGDGSGVYRRGVALRGVVEFSRTPLLSTPSVAASSENKKRSHADAAGAEPDVTGRLTSRA